MIGRTGRKVMSAAQPRCHVRGSEVGVILESYDLDEAVHDEMFGSARVRQPLDESGYVEAPLGLDAADFVQATDKGVGIHQVFSD